LQTATMTEQTTLKKSSVCKLN